MTPSGNPLQRFGVSFSDPALLDRALTHRSAGQANYERLEFLGDALINAVVSIELYARYPRSPEGDLTRLRASLIRESSLADLARRIDLSDYLRMGGGELKSGGYRRESILADTLEALVAAVYLDGGWDSCQKLVRDLFADAFDAVDLSASKDAKTRLQEWLQGRGLPLPEYLLVDTVGKDHDKTFRVACRIGDAQLMAEAEGRSRKSAEQAAATAVLARIDEGSTVRVVPEGL